MKRLKVFTVCAGVGTGEFGLKRLNIPFEVVGYSEINKKAIQCYEQNHKGKNFGDITLVKPNDVPDHNFFMAGFPCQAFSLAGKRLGTEDIRGQVIYYIMKILEEKRPEHVLLENVRGLLSWNKGELFNWIIRELKKIYSTVQHKILNSKDYGVPQNRERIFIYATNKEVPFGWNFIPKRQELKLTLKDMLEENVDSKYYLSKDKFEYCINRAEEKGSKLKINNDIGCTITCGDYKKHQWTNVDLIVHCKQQRLAKGIGGKGHLCKDGETSYCLDKGNSQYIEYQNNIRVLTPLECFRLQGFNDNEINLDNLSVTAKYELAGNGWTLTVVTEIERKIFNHLLI